MKHAKNALLALALVAGPAAFAAAEAGRAPAASRLAAEAPHKDGDHKEDGKPLGSKEIAGYTVKVVQEGPVKAGEEAAFAIVLSGKKEKPKAVRAWVGVESAEGSVKGKAVEEGDAWHAHVEAPKPIPDKSQFWVEIETADGKKKAAFDYK